MKLIVITTPQFFEGEAAAVTSLFQNGLEILHLRKPGASAEEMGNFLQQIPSGYKGHVSRSCHSLEEVLKHKSDCSYVFLSPIYDSISKEGYSSAYSCDTLKKAQQAGIIDSNVMALGGISLEHLPEIAALGFGGAVLLGDVWQQAKEAFIPHFLHLKQLSSHPFNF